MIIYSTDRVTGVRQSLAEIYIQQTTKQLIVNQYSFLFLFSSTELAVRLDFENIDISTVQIV